MKLQSTTTLVPSLKVTYEATLLTTVEPTQQLEALINEVWIPWVKPFIHPGMTIRYGDPSKGGTFILKTRCNLKTAEPGGTWSITYDTKCGLMIQYKTDNCCYRASV